LITINDEIVKVRKHHFLSFRRKPESSNFIIFWMPPYQVRGRLIKSGMTILGLFTSAPIIPVPNPPPNFKIL